MLEIDRTARVEVSASPSRCLEILAAVDRYPSWASLIAAVDILEAAPDGSPSKVRLRGQLLGLPVVMDCELEQADYGAVLRRIPYDADDDERYVATWAVRARGEGAEVELRVVASLDAPGPAGILRGRVERRLVDDLVADLARAVA